ncbi:MAG TPA: DUF6516 family protein [Geminicoccaceae bacterium]|nr:DUF6516 family protein [Geminicoccaceae bacterium]
MKAQLIFSDKQVFEDGSLVEVVVWSVPRSVPPSTHGYKYRLFYGRPGVRLVGYDNERGKGDHRHVLGVETAYVFVSLDGLIEDFRADVLAVSGRRL